MFGNAKVLVEACVKLTIAWLFLTSIEATACSVIPTGYLRSHVELVNDADNIILGTFVGQSSSGTMATFSFRVEQTLKGDERDSVAFSAAFRPVTPEEPTAVDHDDYYFWVGAEGRVPVQPDCSLYPSFDVGEPYLLILGTEFTPRSFESVLSPSDRWYQAIAAALDQAAEEGDVPRLPRSTAVFSVEAFLQQFDSQLIVECRSTTRTYEIGRLAKDELSASARIIDWLMGQIYCTPASGDTTLLVLAKEEKLSRPVVVPIVDGVAELPIQRYELIPNNRLELLP